MPTLSQTAINAALSGDWKKAISANQSILKENKDDINTLSRLAHAYIQIGKREEAKKLYKKILTLDKYNVIALKNLEKLSTLPKHIKSVAGHTTGSYSLSPSLFIEEPGKTKTINLRNIAPVGILSHLNPGNQVTLLPKKHSIDVRTLDKIYVGALPDDFSFRLLKFLKAGYQYCAFIKSVTKNSVNIFIREIKRAKRFNSQPSFLPASSSQIRNLFGGMKNLDTTEDDEENANKPEGQDDFEE